MHPRAVAAGVLLVLSVSGVPSAAGDPLPAVQTVRYAQPHGLDMSHAIVSTDAALPPLRLTPRPGDRSLSLEIADASDRSVILYVYQESRAGDRKLIVDAFCGKRV